MLCPNCNIEIKDYCMKCGYYNGNGNAEIKERKRKAERIYKKHEDNNK